MVFIRHIPNFITLMNLLAGSVSVFFALQGSIEVAALLILAGAIFDFFDGFAARLLKVSSPVGAELDSLSDLVTFGVAPAFMIISVIQIHCDVTTHSGLYALIPTLFPLVLILFSALRLAKFNVDDTQTYDFKGLPTPANALFQVSFAFLLQANTHLISWWFVFPVIIVMALLMVAPISLFGLKKISGSLKYYVAILVLVSILAIVFFKYTAGVYIIGAYIILSGIKSTIRTNANTN